MEKVLRKELKDVCRGFVEEGRSLRVLQNRLRGKFDFDKFLGGPWNEEGHDIKRGSYSILICFLTYLFTRLFVYGRTGIVRQSGGYKG